MVLDLSAPNLTRTLLHSVGAATLTLLAFGIGPVVGLTASQLPHVEVVDGPVQGAPQGTLDMASFALTLAPEAPAAPTADADQEASAAEPAVAEVAVDANAPAAPTPRPAETKPEPEPERTASDHTVARPMTAPKGRRCEVTRSNPKIERTSKAAFTVEKKLVTWYIGHLGELNRLGWSSKHRGADGKSVGMRIGGVKCGNDLHLAGIRSGDVVHRVNGHEVRSIPQAILVYRKVRKDRRLRVELTRRGKPMTLTYRLV